MAARKTNPRPLAQFPGPLLLVGAGKMGQAMLDGWLARGLNAAQGRGDRAAAGEVREGARPARTHAQSKGKAAQAAAIVIAVKPQTAPEAVPPLARLCRQRHAGALDHGRPHACASLERALPGAAIVRAMPNTPAAIGRGITVACANGKVSATPAQARHRSARGHRHGRMGRRREPDGRGHRGVRLRPGLHLPAGRSDDAGRRRRRLPADLAARLARETVAGSGELLHRSELDAATLRQNVTSPGGTTAAALEVLMGPGGFDALAHQGHRRRHPALARTGRLVRRALERALFAALD